MATVSDLRCCKGVLDRLGKMVWKHSFTGTHDSVTKNAEITLLTDPLKFAAMMWPDVTFFDKQRDIICSVDENDMTVVPAGNMLGKDFTAGFIILWFFLSRSPCRIITTSAKDDHLRVLWGEMNRFIQTAKFPLDAKRGGPLAVYHHSIHRIQPNGERCPLSYIKGLVASQDSMAAMQGHHIANVGDGIPRTLFVCDESSSVQDEYWTMARTWANRALILGNTWPCSNFFYRAVKGTPGTKDRGGDQYSNDGKTCYRKVIHIKAEDSPNVRLAVREKIQRKTPSGRIVIPGVKSYEEYTKNREIWDVIQQCVSLDAEFYEGAEVKLYPVEWLNRAESIANKIGGRTYMGVDTGEGGDDTSWCVINAGGILELLAMKTPDTSIIPGRTIAFMEQYGIAHGDVLFDKGGGGYEHVCVLRSKGYKVRTVGFGEAATDPNIVRRMKTIKERTETAETRYVYKNRRAEMYGILRSFLDPAQNEKGFRIDAKHVELRRQLQPLPLLFDEEGRVWLPPKNKKDKTSKTQTIIELLGCSPDEADSLVLACYGLERVRMKITLQVIRTM